MGSARSQADIARRIQVFMITRGRPHPGQRYRHGWIPVAGVDVRLSDMSDDQLLDHFHEISQRDQVDEQALHALDAELARRESASAKRTAIERDIDRLVSQGRDYRSAYAEAHGLDEDRLRRQELAAAVDAQRRPGESRERAVRRMYDEVTELNYRQAEDWTRGHMLNPTGRAAGISARTLFSGPRARARKYASEELARFWEGVTPRQTYAEFRAEMLGRVADVAAVAKSAHAGQGKDFGL